jgi:hypothetical protein
VFHNKNVPMTMHVDIYIYIYIYIYIGAELSPIAKYAMRLGGTGKCRRGRGMGPILRISVDCTGIADDVGLQYMWRLMPTAWLLIIELILGNCFGDVQYWLLVLTTVSCGGC